MASFDDLAFTGPPADTGATAARSTAQLFCRDCDEVAQSTTPDGKRCLICGCELEQRRQQTADHANATGAPLAAGGAQDLQSVMMRLLSEIGNEWNGDGSNARRPASDEAVQHLGSFVADQASTVEVAVVVKGIKGEVIAIPGNFGPCESLEARCMVLAEPFNGAKPFQNADKMQDKIVVMERGGCTFARKTLRAQAAGAAAVIIIQTADVWPYTMTDSTGEGQNVSIPAFMMSQSVGKGFVAYLRHESDEKTTADVVVRKDARECVICQVELAVGMEVTRMPCQHMFHTTCLHEWLQIGNSCPICRVEIAAKRTTHSAAATSQTAQQRGDFSWSDWFS